MPRMQVRGFFVAANLTEIRISRRDTEHAQKISTLHSSEPHANAGLYCHHNQSPAHDLFDFTHRSPHPLPMPTLHIRELETDAQIQGAYNLMAVMRPELKREKFLDDVRLLELDGYRLLGGFVDDQLVALAGVRRAHSLARGPYAFINDLVTHPDHRHQGYATHMLRHIAQSATAQGLPMICLNSYPDVVPFYEKLKFQKMDVIPCWIESATLATPF